jgi:hypothetical protein
MTGYVCACAQRSSDEYHLSDLAALTMFTVTPRGGAASKSQYSEARYDLSMSAAPAQPAHTTRHQHPFIAQPSVGTGMFVIVGDVSSNQGGSDGFLAGSSAKFVAGVRGSSEL